MNGDSLISSPPIDVVIQRRHAVLQNLAEQKRRVRESKPAKVKKDYNRLLRSFAAKYFQGKTEYYELLPQEEKALAKVCLRQSLKTSLIASLTLCMTLAILVPMGKTAGGMVYNGLFGLVFGALLVVITELVLDITNSFHIYERVQFVLKHFYLKRKKLLPF